MTYDVCDDIKERVESYAQIYGYDDFIVTISLNGKITTELLLCDNGDLEWANEWWWECKDDVRLLGFLPLSHIKIFAKAVQIGRPVFGPDPVLVAGNPAMFKETNMRMTY